jgi:hypothetical protein
VFGFAIGGCGHCHHWKRVMMVVAVMAVVTQSLM